VAREGGDEVLQLEEVRDGPIGVSELGVMAHRGRADGAAATAADSGGSGDGRGPEEGGLLARPGKKRKQRRERKGVAVPGRPFYTGTRR
jgi:hypothetical protein